MKKHRGGFCDTYFTRVIFDPVCGTEGLGFYRKFLRNDEEFCAKINRVAVVRRNHRTDDCRRCCGDARSESFFFSTSFLTFLRVGIHILYVPRLYTRMRVRILLILTRRSLNRTSHLAKKRK